jgi:hypothetical protein
VVGGGAGMSLGATGRPELVRNSGATLYYQRRWSEDWMSVAGVSTQWAGNSGTCATNARLQLSDRYLVR